MIGWVEFVKGGATVEAILRDDGRWSCDVDPNIADLLDRVCVPTGDPADDTWGHDALIKAAHQLRGIAWLGPGRTS